MKLLEEMLMKKEKTLLDVLNEQTYNVPVGSWGSWGISAAGRAYLVYVSR
jgi:hypothetical protein